MSRATAVLVLPLVLALACAVLVASAAPAEPEPIGAEVLGLADRMEQLHPNLFHGVSRDRFRSEAEALAARAPTLSRDELVVGLMRLAALPGGRDGHTGIFPFDAHARPLQAYPLRLWDFADGLRVVGAPGHPELVGRRLTGVDGMPVDRVLELVRPLVPHDNGSSLRWLLPEFVVTAEVLRGLGIVHGATAAFAFADGSTVSLSPADAGEVVAELGSPLSPPAGARTPVWLRRLDRTQWLTTIAHGRVVYLGYRLTSGSTGALARRLLRLARRPQTRAVIVDIRLNPGGNNRTYRPLLDALASRTVDRPGRLALLLGRATFSAAGNFATDVDQSTHATLVGETSGGARDQWGDAEEVPLALAGLTAHVATSYQQYGRPGFPVEGVDPDLSVEPTVADVLAGRDPVLERALAIR